MGIIVSKKKLAESGDFNLSGERYREAKKQRTKFPLIKLSDIAEIASGNSAPQGNEYFEGGEYYFIRTSDVGKVHLSDNFVGSVDRINQLAIEEKRMRMFPAGTILFPKSGASTFLNHRVILGAPSYVSSHLACIICNENMAISKYVYHQLCEEDAKDITPDQAYPSLRLRELGRIEIPLPPLEVQKEIVAEIEGYQRVINGARAVIDNYRPHIPIDPEWEFVKLGQIANFTQGTQVPVDEQKTYYSDGYIRFIRIVDYTQESKDLRFIKDPGQKNHCDESDIIMVRYGAVGFVGRGLAGVFANNLFKIQFHSSNVNNDFGFYLFKTDNFKDFINRVTLQSSMPALSHKVVKEYDFPLPPLEIQKQIVAEIEAEQALIDANRELITRFEKKIQATLARIWGEEGQE